MTGISRRQLHGYAGAGFLAALLDAGAAQAQSGGIKRVTHAISASDISSLDPTLAWVSAEVPINTVVMEGLVSYPPGTVSTDFQPGLAESWTLSSDGKTYTFKLRRGVQWHGGFGEFTADDVLFSMQRYRDPAVSPWTASYTNVVSVTAPDPYTVVFALKAADPFFPSSLASDTESVGLMVCKKAFEARGAAAMRFNPIGTGPFAFKDYVPKDHVTMVRNDSYWGGKPHLDEVVIRFVPSSAARELGMRTGEIDSFRAALDGQIVDRLIREGYVVDIKGPQINWWLHINTRMKPLDDIRVRKAIAHAVNAQEMLALLGKVAMVPAQMVGPDYFGAATPADFPAEDRWDYDPAKAKSLLAEAGQTGLKLSMIISQRDDYRQMMVMIQEQLKRVGITLTLNQVDHAFYHSQIVKNVNPLVLYGDISYPNAEIMLMRAFRKGALRNFSGLESPVFESLMDRVAASPHLDERKTLLVQAQQEVAKHSVLIPVAFSGQPLARLKRVQLGYVLKSSLALEYRYSQLSDITA